MLINKYLNNVIGHTKKLMYLIENTKSFSKKKNQFYLSFSIFFFVHVENIFNNIFLYSYNTTFLKFIEIFPEFILLLLLCIYLIFILKKDNNFQNNL
jgi:hypothetical protein